MLALALSLSVLSAAPRGLAAATPLELVTQVEARLPRWLKGGGDLKALLANQQELGDYLSDFPVPPADRKSMLALLVKEQSDRPTLDTFTATHALVHVVNRHIDLTFYDEADHSCLVALFSVSDGERDREDRYVLVAGPSTTRGAFEYAATGPGAGVRLEKKGAAWALMPPPPGCRGALERVAAAV